MASFVPRKTFPALPSLPRSFFLGHHRAGLESMKSRLASVDLIVECRDYRIPLTSRNPAFEKSLASQIQGNQSRLVVYTKRDLGSSSNSGLQIEAALAQIDKPHQVIFTALADRATVVQVLAFMRRHLRSLDQLTGSRMMIVGMPNVGKSSLLNALRRLGLNEGKAAKTGSEPGVTRKIGSGVKIIDGDSQVGNIYLLDTPGVFVPYIEDSEAMLKLALCGSVKDSIIGSTILADYLLFCLNTQDPRIYREYAAPTNDVDQLLSGVARKTGRIQKGGGLDLEGAGTWLVQQWRNGKLGRFCLDALPDGSSM